ncbi:hypothetical protein ACFWR9_13720 [Streptomyces sp. NPDC058534]|uniref:hypothetical protein n=1 Tax=Streptomyces sp. NPDC058534 TaxID=3346541 RepID=UPI0036662583
MANSEAAIHEIVAAAAEPYLAAVVAQLAADGVPAAGSSIPPDPSPDDIDGEADGSIDIPFEFTTRHYGPDLEELGVWWNSVSGWRVHTQFVPDPRPGDGRQWMGRRAAASAGAGLSVPRHHDGRRHDVGVSGTAVLPTPGRQSA